MKKILLAISLIMSLLTAINAQELAIDRIEPPCWWVGMNEPNLQLMIHGKNVGLATLKLEAKGVKVSSKQSIENPNYLFVNLEISPDAAAGKLPISLSFANKKISYDYELKARQSRTRGVDASDVIYLITPDRFANGDTKNDNIKGMEGVDRQNKDARHGGDIEGVIQKLDYLQNFGITTLWLNPFLENNQPKYSYHGYAISDFYKTDARLGTNDDFKRLVNLSHERKMKVIMDMVFNHCGSGHWWMSDLPSKDWINQWDKFTKSNFENIASLDMHASQYDKNRLTKGWFDTNMPDLNLENPLLANYMIQNALWWVEYADLDGIRMDTYPYPNNKHVMAQWAKRMMSEYPQLYLVSETWVERASSEAYWQRQGLGTDGYKSYLNSVSDYPMYFAMMNTFRPEGGIYELYKTIGEDFLYQDPNQNKIFACNHDVDRFYSLVGENLDKFKLGMAFLLTTRGIPQLYYGDEILIKGVKDDGIRRTDFTGGWAEDQKNAFTAQGRTAEQNDAYNYLNTILQWRKSSKSIHKGKLVHFIPEKNVYVYFRYTDTEKVMIVLNYNSQEVKDFDLTRFDEFLGQHQQGKEIISGASLNQLKTLNLAAFGAQIIELK